MQKLDKKQLPQLVALIGLTCLVFGWFAFRMMMPSPAAAGSAAPAAATPAPTTGAAASAAATPGASGATPAGTASAAATVAGPPAPGMRDPFVQTISAVPNSKPASAGSARSSRLSRLTTMGQDGPISVPDAPPLPAVGLAPLAPGVPARSGLAPMPVALAAPLWTVTGILQSGSEQVAILRNGDVRLFVKQGDTVDGQFQVARVTRSAVLLRRGSANYTLGLGEAQSPPAGASRPQAAPVQSPIFLAAPALLSAPAPAPLKSPAPTLGASVLSLRPTLPRLALPRPAAAAPQLALTSFAASLPVPAVPLHGTRNHAFALSLADLKPSAVSILSQATLPRSAWSGKAVVKVAGLRQFARISRRIGMNVADYTLPSALLPTGMLAPDFSLSTLSGQALGISDFRGRVVLLCFWASWVPSCEDALSGLEALQNELGGQGLTVLSVNSWDSKPAMSAFVRAHQLSQITLCDTRVPNQSVAVALYHAPDLPAFYLIDADGRVAASFAGFGPHTLTHLRAALAKMGVSE